MNNIQHLKKPDWLKITLGGGESFSHVKETLEKNNLHTVCKEAHCPNLGECWSSGTATFLILGDTCTRNCRFCNVKTGNPKCIIDNEEPLKIANFVKEIGLKYVVITSVDRDDLDDGGSEHFAETISQIKEINKEILVEVLTPDFKGNEESIFKVVQSKPDVFGHNIETVERLTKDIRDKQCDYHLSLSVLNKVKELQPNIFTKSSILVGVGETEEEIIQTMCDLRENRVDFITLGQYLQPSKKQIPVAKYISPEEFKSYEKQAEKLGFLFVASGPMVRSSYKASEYFVKKMKSL